MIKKIINKNRYYSRNNFLITALYFNFALFLHSTYVENFIFKYFYTVNKLYFK